MGKKIASSSSSPSVPRAAATTTSPASSSPTSPSLSSCSSGLAGSRGSARAGCARATSTSTPAAASSTGTRSTATEITSLPCLVGGGFCTKCLCSVIFFVWRGGGRACVWCGSVFAGRSCRGSSGMACSAYSFGCLNLARCGWRGVSCREGRGMAWTDQVFTLSVRFVSRLNLLVNTQRHISGEDPWKRVEWCLERCDVAGSRKAACAWLHPESLLRLPRGIT